MPSDVATAIAYVGAFVGLVGGGVGLFNSWKSVSWKRAELANNYMKEFNGDAELVFAGRCLDWYGGRLAVPDNLLPYLDEQEKYIEHDRTVFAQALRADLTIVEMNDDPRLQLYRTAIDSFLSWLSLVASALDRKLFKTADIELVGYWVAKIESEPVLFGFIRAYGYEKNISKLIKAFRRGEGVYKDWRFPTPASLYESTPSIISRGRTSYTFPNR